MMNIERLLEQRMCAMFDQTAPAPAVLAGVSGGADSVCLLSLLVRLRERYGYELHCAHVNHGIRGVSADRDERFVADLCGRWDAPFHLLRADVPSVACRQKIGLEEAGRNVRYDFFYQEAGKLGKPCCIMTAHNANDRLETFLLNLIRGAGIKGLAGMEIQNGMLYRPLLTTTREEIEAYCTCAGLDYCRDETNETCDYTRNWVRHHLAEPMTQRFPYVLNSAGRAMDLLADADHALDQAAEPQIQGDHCQIENLLSLPTAVRHRVLQRFGEKAGLHFDYKKVMLIDTVLQKGSGRVSVGGGYEAVATAGGLFLHTSSVTAAFCEELTGGHGVFNLPDGVLELRREKKINDLSKYAVLDCAKIRGKLVARNRRPADSIQLPGRPEKRLKKLFNEARIPLFERDRLLLLCDEQGVVYAEGLGTAQRAAADEYTTEAAVILWRRNSKNGTECNDTGYGKGFDQ